MQSPSSDTAWKAIPGSALTFGVPDGGADALFIANTSQEAQGSGQCHAAYSFELDGVTVGEPTGMSINVSPSPAAPYAAVTLLGAASYSEPGTHQLALRVSNTSVHGATCAWNERTGARVIAVLFPRR